MSGESEHSDSELYYPGKLSDAELLQLPTHSECTERKSTLLHKWRSLQVTLIKCSLTERGQVRMYRDLLFLYILTLSQILCCPSLLLWVSSTYSEPFLGPGSKFIPALLYVWILYRLTVWKYGGRIGMIIDLRRVPNSLVKLFYHTPHFFLPELIPVSVVRSDPPGWDASPSLGYPQY